MRRLAGALVAGSIILSTQVGLAAVAQTAQAAVPTAVRAVAAPAAAQKYKFKNCTALNKVYPHGVGKKGARDHTSGKRVTTFKVSTSLYKKIVGYRSSLDRDKDGIACERR
jgi:hypothetical protein